jgi:hypothetical protein
MKEREKCHIERLVGDAQAFITALSLELTRVPPELP